MTARIPVVVLGATGSVGQRFVSLLANHRGSGEPHPWFELAGVAASERSAGRPYGDVVDWTLPGGVPAAARDLVVERVDEALPERCDARIAFSALDASVAEAAERAFARAGRLVVTNARPFRLHPEVPLLVPEVNADHLALSARWSDGEGAILANPNCSTIGLALALAPLARQFGVEAAHVVTLQALSGAGRPGLPALDALDNVVPFIPGEEEKLASETGKILGRLEGGCVAADPIVVSAQCNRVAVRDGHTLCVSARLGRDVDAEAILEAWRSFRGLPQELELPSAPRRPIVVDPSEAAPQPALHRDVGHGMSVVVGRLRTCPVLGWRFVALSHNTVRGAAGGALLCAELALADELRGRVSD